LEEHGSSRSTRSSRLARLARQSRTCRVESSRVEPSGIWAYQVKFSRKLLGKRVRRHINIKSVTLNAQSVRQPWTRMLAVVYESSGQPLPQVSEEGHSRSSPVLFEAPQLLMAYLSSLWYPACDRLSSWHPHMIIKQIKIWRVWWPFMLRNKIICCGV